MGWKGGGDPRKGRYGGREGGEGRMELRGGINIHAQTAKSATQGLNHATCPPLSQDITIQPG